MFSQRTDASKTAFAYLVQQLEHWGFALIDCQLQTKHLDSLGAMNIPRSEFIKILNLYCDEPGIPAPWKLELSALEVIDGQRSRSK